MALPAQVVLDILAHGGSVRVSIKGLQIEWMMQFAAKAKDAGVFVEFVAGGTTVQPSMLNNVSSAGQGHVRWDFASQAE
jgi:hypothetical protein